MSPDDSPMASLDGRERRLARPDCDAGTESPTVLPWAGDSGTRLALPADMAPIDSAIPNALSERSALSDSPMTEADAEATSMSDSAT